MKTLDEVEPRIPIPGSATATGTFVIDNPGSYYLAGDRNASGTGIEVNADNVTIDLMGYQLIGPGSGTNYGINTNGFDNVEIRNGTVRDFQIGIYEINSTARSHRVINVRAILNSQQGIYLKGGGHLVKDCTASENGASAEGYVYGIYVETSCTVTDCTVLDNGAGALSRVYGIYADDGSEVRGNTASHNGNYASSYVYGIYADASCTVTANMANHNGTSASANVRGILAAIDCTVTGNTANHNGISASGNVYGIYAGTGCTVTGNTANKNATSATLSGLHVGIYVPGSCTVTGNTANHNGQGAAGSIYGINLWGYSLVDQNTAYNNGGTNMNTPGSCTFGVNEY
jgi:hypothetical protein